jgi:hypothetical protein
LALATGVSRHDITFEGEPMTTAEQPPPEGDEQPPQATEETEKDSDAPDDGQAAD